MCNLPANIAKARDKFAIACKEAAGLEIVGNFAAAFNAGSIMAQLQEALSDEVINTVFMPLMNRKIGFMTDRTGIPNKAGRTLPLYGANVVRDAIIDAVIIGLLPTGNQFNIIAGRMYPTKEGYTAMLKRLGAKYLIEIGKDRSQTPQFAELECHINYQFGGEKNSFTIVATVKRDEYSSNDQLRGKAERKAKKALYEYLTGSDFGDADEASSRPERVAAVEVVAEEIQTKANTGEAIGIEDAEVVSETADAPTATPTPTAAQPQAAPQAETPNPGF